MLCCVVEDDYPPIAAASMWTRKDVKEFKDSLKKDKDSVIKVGSGETVTVSIVSVGLFWPLDVFFFFFFQECLMQSFEQTKDANDSKHIRATL